MKKLLKVLFIIGMVVYLIGTGYYPDYSDAQMFCAIMFAVCFLGFILITTVKGERRIRL